MPLGENHKAVKLSHQANYLGTVHFLKGREVG